jgi:hypothetical protein
MNKPSRMVPFVIGLVLGVLGAVFLPGYVQPYLPEWVMGKATVVKGTVAAKQKKETVLLLTVNTAEGALLATFTRKVDEIALLVNEKDVIEFTLPKYAPLIEDPKITRILKGQDVASAPAPAGGPAEKGATDVKIQQQGNIPAAVPAQGSTTGKKQLDRK